MPLWEWLEERESLDSRSHNQLRVGATPTSNSEREEAVSALCFVFQQGEEAFALLAFLLSSTHPPSFPSSLPASLPLFLPCFSLIGFLNIAQRDLDLRPRFCLSFPNAETTMLGYIGSSGFRVVVRVQEGGGQEMSM